MERVPTDSKSVSRTNCIRYSSQSSSSSSSPENMQNPNDIAQRGAADDFDRKVAIFVCHKWHDSRIQAGSQPAPALLG